LLPPKRSLFDTERRHFSLADAMPGVIQALTPRRRRCPLPGTEISLPFSPLFRDTIAAHSFFASQLSPLL